MEKIDKICCTVSAAFVVAGLVFIGSGLYLKTETKEIRANNVKYVAADPEEVVDTDVDFEDEEEEEKEYKLSADEVQEIVETSKEFKRKIKKFKSLMYNGYQLEEITPVGDVYVLTYRFESSHGEMRCKYNSKEKKVTIGRIYNYLDKEYPVVFWLCGHVPNIAERSYKHMTRMGYTGVYQSESMDDSIAVAFSDNNSLSEVLDLEEYVE